MHMAKRSTKEFGPVSTEDVGKNFLDQALPKLNLKG